nr:hypothetical protein [Tanacetum cinerariifolium]
MTLMASFSEFLASKLILWLHFSSLACIEPVLSLVLRWKDELKVCEGVEGANGQGGGEVDWLVNKGDGESKMGTCSDVGVKVVKAQRIKPTLYDGIVMSDKHVDMPIIDDEETLILEEESRSRMSKKEKDPEAIKQKISHKPIDYDKLNRLNEDFRKRFTPQQELSAKLAFWMHMPDPTSKPFDALLVKTEAPKELPKISLVNESLKKLKFHLAKFDSVVKIRTTPNALTEGE